MKSFLSITILSALAALFVGTPVDAQDDAGDRGKRVQSTADMKLDGRRANSQPESVKRLPACMPRHKPSTCDWTRLKEQT